MDKDELQHKYHHKTPGKSVKWKRKIKFLLLIVCVIGVVFWWKRHSYVKAGDNIQEISQEDCVDVEEESESGEREDFTLCTISEGDIPANVFGEHGNFDANDVATLLDSSEEVYDFTNLKIGRDLRFYFDEGGDDERADRVEYDLNTEKKIILERDGDEFKAYEEKIKYETSQATAKGKIENFFYVDAMNAGLEEATVLEVGDIFAFSIDFMTEIREGDEFVFEYEKRKRNGEVAPDGRILAAKFVNDGKPHYAYYFATSDGEGGYYDGEGHVLERQFLKAPLSYRRISSGFTGARLHPITKKVTAHYQIDYAAPTGTPVVASGRGTVTQAGWAGGWGNIVRIKHDNGYTTHYAHLSKFAKGIKSGARVAQGQLVGYVGSTGWSTGPHLDYGMKLDGKPINPLTFIQKKGEPLDEESMKIFEENKKKYGNILN